MSRSGAPLSSLGLPPELQSFVSSASEVFDQMKESEGLGDAHDRCSYAIYLDNANADVSSLHADICAFVERHSHDYMWFRDAFCLGMSPPSPPSAAAREDPAAFEGSIRFGDCLDDEWFLVFLLLELSKAMPELSCRIWDADGDFLLIEAAERIPGWLTPENSTNRVWIRQGAIHIVPLDEPGRLPCGGIQLGRALDCLRTQPLSQSKAEPAVQACIAARTLDAYPAYAIATRHTAVCTLPRAVAAMLLLPRACLSLVPAAVNALCSSEKDRAKSVAALARLGPLLQPGTQQQGDGGGDSDSTAVPVRFTRALFARLTFQPFSPPQRLLPWARRATDWAAGQLDEGGGEARRLAARSVDLGCRLLCGLEAAYQLQGDAAALMDVLRAHAPPSTDAAGAAGGESAGALLRAGDDEAWLHLSPAQLDEEMQARCRGGEGEGEQEKGGRRKEKEAGEDGMEAIVEGMERFMRQESGLRGVVGGSAAASTPDAGAGVGGLSVDLPRLEAILRGVLGERNDGWEDDDDEDYEEGEEEEEEGGEEQKEGHAGCAKVTIDEKDEDAWEGDAEADSDDEDGDEEEGDDDDSMDSAEYAALLEAELRESTLLDSFERSSDGEVDVEHNLLTHLLESHASQGGRPGPASALLSQLGVRLPDPPA